LTTRRDIRATETAAANSRAAGPAGAGATDPSPERAAYLNFIRSLARAAARADHAPEPGESA
jgi:hypothetical protein